VAVAHTIQCPYCIEVHVKGAEKAGASKEEVAEAVLLAAALRAGGAAAHDGMAMRFFDEA
jgi:AhpD family alkylhydroperoxidase